LKITIDEKEIAISEVIQKSSLIDDDTNYICGQLARILNNFFSVQEKETGLRSWAIDDMYPDETEIDAKKLTLKGKIYWLDGGGDCVYYQADIARNTTPLLYSVKLKTKHDKQIMYIGKSHKGWVLNIE